MLHIQQHRSVLEAATITKSWRIAAGFPMMKKSRRKLQNKEIERGAEDLPVGDRPGYMGRSGGEVPSVCQCGSFG